jgi:hypothetical protein
MTDLIRSMDELVARMRQRKDELNLPAEVIDDLAGLPTRYTAKVLAKMKSPGYISLGPMLETLGLAIRVVEDQAALERMRPRYIYRKRSSAPRKSTEMGGASMPANVRVALKMLGELNAEARILAGASIGGKKRAKKLSKRARRHIAKQAAAARWAPRSTAR